MDQLTDRLRECFRTVFEDMSDEQIEAAVRADVAEWDSLGTLTLLTVVEEEFGIVIDDEAAESLDSFVAVRSAVDRAIAV